MPRMFSMHTVVVVVGAKVVVVGCGVVVVDG
jgi:hypothetical protein